MADPLTIIGGLSAVIGLCGTAHSFVTTACRFVKQAGGAFADVKHFENQVETFSEIIGVAQVFLNDYCKRNEKFPSVVSLRSRDILQKIRDQATLVQKRLQDVVDRVKGLGSSPILWASIKWIQNKSSISELLDEMEKVKTSLNFLVALAGHEEQIRSGRDNSDAM